MEKGGLWGRGGPAGVPAPWQCPVGGALRASYEWSPGDPAWRWAALWWPPQSGRPCAGPRGHNTLFGAPGPLAGACTQCVHGTPRGVWAQILQLGVLGLGFETFHAWTVTSSQVRSEPLQVCDLPAGITQLLPHTLPSIVRRV